MDAQPVRYLESFDGTKIAYSVAGSGPPVILLPSWLTHLHYQDRSVAWQPWLDALGGRYTLIRFDPRGCGLSDRDLSSLTFDAWVRDLDALVGKLAFATVSLIGVCQGGAVALEYAARFPGRIDRLVLYGTYARGRDKRGDIAMEPEKANVMREMIRLGWGAEDHAFATAFAKQFQPGGSDEHLRSWCELQRMAATPTQALAMTEIMFNIDIRSAASIVGCPTLVAHAERDAVVPAEEGRLLAQTIPRARFLSLDTANHFMLREEPAWAQFEAALYAFLPSPKKTGDAFTELTARERDVLHELAKGRDNAEIAVALDLKEKTIRNHVSAIFDKLDLHSRAKVVVAAREAGFGRGSTPSEGH